MDQLPLFAHFARHDRPQAPLRAEHFGCAARTHRLLPGVRALTVSREGGHYYGICEACQARRRLWATIARLRQLVAENTRGEERREETS